MNKRLPGRFFIGNNPTDPHYTAHSFGVEMGRSGKDLGNSNLERINQRLKEDGVRLKLMAIGPSLYLRGMFPSKDGIGTKQYKLKIPEVDLRAADMKARKIGEFLRLGNFDWGLYEGQSASAVTLGEFREAARRFYESKFDNESSWGTKYQPALNKLPTADYLPVSEQLLITVVRSMPENSAARRDQGNVLAQIATHLKMDGESIQEAARGYSAKELKKRDLPSDALIESIYKKIKAPHWKWMYGMCATFGLRPHEIVECQITEDGNCEIGDETKTGFHVAWPCNERWVETFNLREIHRPTQDKYTVDKAANLYLKVRGPMPFVLYDLRHAYAIRLFKKEVPISIAARLMGHSEATHRKNYQRWFEGREVNELRHRYKL